MANADWQEFSKKLIEFIEHAPVASGVCCCGDNMENHADPMISGHSAVDMWDWSVICLQKEYKELCKLK